MGLSSAIGVPFLRNGVCLLPCGGSAAIYVSFLSYFVILFPSFVPPPPSTTITFSVQPSSNRQTLLAQTKHVVVLSNLKLISPTNCTKICGHQKRPPPEPPPPEKLKVPRYFVYGCVIVIVFSFCYLSVFCS
jgi:hypothetical protein